MSVHFCVQNLLFPCQKKLTGIYIIRNIIDGRVYVGSTGEDFHIRYKKHLSRLLENKHHSSHLQNFFLKYGKETLSFEVLEVVTIPEGKTKKELRPLILEREQFYLDSLRCYSPEFGFNCYKDARSPLGLERSMETRLKISRSRLERGIKHTEESLEKLREANKGEKNKMFGKTHSPAARQKISIKATGRKHKAETKSRMKERMTGELNPSYGAKMSAEHRAKLKSILSKKVICKSESGEVIKIYPSVTATRLDGFDYTSVSKACLGKYGRRPSNRYRGFYWEFENPEHSS